jgi:hypothetical protein
VHPTYRHLEDRIRLGGLTLGQWSQLVVCGLAAYALSMLLPLPGSWSVSVAVTVCGLPAACAVAFMSADFDVLALVRSAARWRRSPKRYAGTQDPRDDAAQVRAGAPAIGFDAESLWD